MRTLNRTAFAILTAILVAFLILPAGDGPPVRVQASAFGSTTAQRAQRNAQAPGPSRVQVPRRPTVSVPPPPPSMTSAAKMQKAKEMFRFAKPPRGITDELVLTPRTPYVANQGYINFDGMEWINLGQNFAYGSSTISGDFGQGSYIALFILGAASTGKPHLITFYFRSLQQQTIAVGIESNVQRNDVAEGTNTISYVLIPTSAAIHEVYFLPDRGRWVFYRVEVSVIN